MSTMFFSGLPGAIAGNVRAEAVRRGFTQTSLAKALGCAQSVISLKWRGERQWQLGELEPVADVLGVSVSKLLNYELPHLDSNQEPAD